MEFALKVLFFATFTCVGKANTPCQEEELCRCALTKAAGITIDCHGKSVNITYVCTLCEKYKDIESLDISKTGLTQIPEFCFKDCRKLNVLSLASNTITKLPMRVFEGLHQLKTLSLNNNKLLYDGKIVDPQIFKPLMNLERLHIVKNAYTSLNSSDIFYLQNILNDTLQSLKYLYLDGLPYAVFGPNFRNFRNLTTIDFSGNKSNCSIISLTNVSFINVPYVRRLDLSSCKLSSVDAGTFQPLRELRFLNLSYNMALGFGNLRNVSYGLQFTRINVLDYSKVYKTFGLTTQVNRCDIKFLQNTTLKEIRLNGNRISSFETNALTLAPSTLEVVFIEDNSLSFGPYALQVGCIENLKRLELSRQDFAHGVGAYNQEVTIHENNRSFSGGCVVTRASSDNCHLLSSRQQLMIQEVSFPRKLKSIHVRSSHLRFYPSVLRIPLHIKTTLESLDISHNILYQWSGVFYKIESLKRLNLSNNYCSHISEEFFSNFPNIETLDASFNKIGQYLVEDINGSTFSHLHNLKFLNLSNNWIENLPENIFISSRSLELFDLSFNQLENLIFRYDHMDNLSTLQLQQNKISTLSLKLLHHLARSAKEKDKNASIDLSGNPLDATCKNIDFLNWVVERPHYFVNIETYIFLRDGHRQISYTDLVEDFSAFHKSCHQYTALIIFSTCFIIVFILIIVGGITYRYRWRLRYFYYMTKARYLHHITEFDGAARKEYHYDIFISYATDNYHFVTGEMYSTLEDAGLSMCLHQKDFLPGNDIADNIVTAVRNSKLTLLVLSPAFLESKWCIYEFNMARMESIYSRGGENTVFVVLFENIDITLVSQEMRDYLDSESYLAYPREEEDRPYFWQMLIQAITGTDYRMLD